jgi:hypothetical protein
MERISCDGLARLWAMLACAGVCVACSDNVSSIESKGGGGGSGSCDIGIEGCECTQGGACDPGLECVDDVCVDLGDDVDAEPDDETFREDDGGDFPDCYDECSLAYVDAPFDIELDADKGATGFSVNGKRYDTLRGTIDGQAHQGAWGYDVDMISVRLRPRTLVEIVVEAPGDSKLDPFVSTFDPVMIPFSPLFGWLTQNDDAGSDTKSARTVIASPTSGEQVWFTVVDDARNVLGAGEPRGGSAYRYEMSLRVLGQVEFADLDLENEVRLEDVELERAGDIHYYRYEDPGHGSYRIEFEAHQDDFCGHVFQLDLLEGAGWIAEGVNDDDPEDGCTQSLEFETVRGAYDPADDSFAFVVTDYLGRGSNLGLGDFSYDLRVTSVD